MNLQSKVLIRKRLVTDEERHDFRSYLPILLTFFEFKIQSRDETVSYLQNRERNKHMIDYFGLCELTQKQSNEIVMKSWQDYRPTFELRMLILYTNLQNHFSRNQWDIRIMVHKL